MPSAGVRHARPSRAAMPEPARASTAKRGEDYSEFLICKERHTEAGLGICVSKETQHWWGGPLGKKRRRRGSEATSFVRARRRVDPLRASICACPPALSCRHQFYYSTSRPSLARVAEDSFAVKYCYLHILSRSLFCPVPRSQQSTSLLNAPARVSILTSWPRFSDGRLSPLSGHRTWLRSSLLCSCR